MRFATYPSIVAAAGLAACTASSGPASTGDGQGVAVRVQPETATAPVGTQVGFLASVTGSANTSVEWTVDDTGCGAVTQTGVYSAPGGAATCRVRATSVADRNATDFGTVTVVEGGDPGPIGHPRLWVRAADVPRLRSWVSSANPMWQNGLRLAVARARAAMDSGTVPTNDAGGSTWSPHYTESYAALFAFMSLVDPDPVARTDWALRARTLLMAVMNSVASDDGSHACKWCSASFSNSDRARWVGESWGLTVDWIYPHLSASDRRVIRRVFLRWAREIQAGYPTVTQFNTNPGAVPSGTARWSDPSLLDLSDPHRKAIRMASNNHGMGKARNMFMLAAALDPADDVADPLVPGDFDGGLRWWGDEAIGTYLYMTDYMFRNDGRGGLSPEGPQYGYSLGFYIGFLLAVNTAGWNDAAKYGPKVSFEGNPFFDGAVRAFLHWLPSSMVQTGDFGMAFQPPWFGDAEKVYLQDYMKVFGPLGVYDGITGNGARLAKIRWIQANAPPGGASALLSRADDSNDDTMMRSVFYFMLFDPSQPGNPAAGQAPDPRAAEPLLHHVPGLGITYVRTGWGSQDRFLTHKLSWASTDHQHGDGNMIQFYRKGEWLTTDHSAYGHDAAVADFKNTLAVQNDPTTSINSFWAIARARGSQFINAAHASDPSIVATSNAPEYFHVTGDATGLYNFDYGGATLREVSHVSRSLLWLKPDVIVVLDRASTTSPGRFKRFWLNLPGVSSTTLSPAPTVSGHQVSATTPGGQRLFVNTVYPPNAGAALTITDTTSGLGDYYGPAAYSPVGTSWTGGGARQLRVDAVGDPQHALFLHVIEGADAGASPSSATPIESSAGVPYRGVAVIGRAVLFPVTLGGSVTSTRFVVPAGISPIYVTGLSPGGAYTATITPVGGGRDVTVQSGGALTADAGGVLVVP